LVTTVANLGTVPTGSIKMFGGAAAPAGYVLCQGQPINRTTYAALFAAIGTTYGAGDGSTTFNVPSMKGKFVVGHDTGDVDYNTLGKTGGEKKHTLILDEIPAHSHYVKEVNRGEEGSSGIDQSVGDWAEPGTQRISSSAGGGLSHENRPPFISLNYIIKL